MLHGKYTKVLTPGGKHQKHSHRKRTMFTEDQLEALEFLFSQNPYPPPSLQKEMALKLEIHPTVLQVWFKNHRAKLKKAQYKHMQQKPEPEQEHGAGVDLKTSSPKRNMATSPGFSHGAYPASLVYTDHPIPSFQLRICPNLKALPDHSIGHKIVHFGCCQDPNIYSLCPILESQILSASFTANPFGSTSPQRAL
ncbi:divergent paired-related homeobox [Leopardus geoffroyi]|uniref:divergent paired-related homeobox n=1 Tax=Leopardus geoffroyi TaxID=46844 RepID=UPI001E260F3B|nr:divergent paired-related homeobox [Leopardus geoffroyi]